MLRLNKIKVTTQQSLAAKGGRYIKVSTISLYIAKKATESGTLDKKSWDICRFNSFHICFFSKREATFIDESLESALKTH